MKIIMAAASLALITLGGCSLIGEPLKIETGPAYSDGNCPSFKERYPQCNVKFGNKGLSVLNSVYETFVGEGAFEIYEFGAKTLSDNEFVITAQSNRGELISEIKADRLVRVGQDKENEKLYLTHQSSYCHSNKIYEHQAVYIDDEINIQDLQFSTENDEFVFMLYQNGSKTAEVRCK